jgi:hypothetical protein
LCAPGRAQSLGGASPLHTRQREVLAEHTTNLEEGPVRPFGSRKKKPWSNGTQQHASSLCAIQLFGSLDIVIVADDRRDILVMGLPLQPRLAVVDLPLAVRGKRFIAPG